MTCEEFLALVQHAEESVYLEREAELIAHIEQCQACDLWEKLDSIEFDLLFAEAFPQVARTAFKRTLRTKGEIERN